MVQHDFIKDEIERMGRAIGKLITLITGTEGGDLTPELRQSVIHQQLRKELGTDPGDLLSLPRADLIRQLDELNLQPAHLDQLAVFLTEWGHTETDTDVRANLYRRAMLLYDLAGERSGVFYPARVAAGVEVRALLEAEIYGRGALRRATRRGSGRGCTTWLEWQRKWK